MYKKKKLSKINKIASREIIEIKAILEALSDIEQSHYPVNVMIEIIIKKITKIFKEIQRSSEILKIT
jgi:hypothetical protein